MENHNDWTQDDRRGNANVDDRGNLCKRPVAELGGLEPGFFSGAYPDRDVLNGGALTPAGRMGLELPGGAAPVFGTNRAYAATGLSTASSCAQLYHSYDPRIWHVPRLRWSSPCL